MLTVLKRVVNAGRPRSSAAKALAAAPGNINGRSGAIRVTWGAMVSRQPDGRNWALMPASWLSQGSGIGIATRYLMVSLRCRTILV